MNGSLPLPAKPCFSKPDQFDFEDWATLYQNDALRFEARRQAVLAIELAKAGPSAAKARVCLSNLEATLQGKSPEERARISLLWMAESLVQLQNRLADISKRMNHSPAQKA
jgi:hypothetical protein